MYKQICIRQGKPSVVAAEFPSSYLLLRLAQTRMLSNRLDIESKTTVLYLLTWE